MTGLWQKCVEHLSTFHDRSLTTECVILRQVTAEALAIGWGWMGLCYTRGVMAKGLMTLITAMAAGWLWAQDVVVRLAPTEIYLGDAFSLRVETEAGQIAALEPVFSGPARVGGNATGTVTVNGRSTWSRSMTVVPEQAGTYRLERLTVRLADGSTRDYDGHPEVRVAKLEADPEVSLTMRAEPADPMPGDTVTLVVECRTPALKQGNRAISPFFGEDFFRGVVPRAPNIRVPLPEAADSPLRQTDRGALADPVPEGERLLWRLTFPFRAERAGEVTFSAPVLNDTRIVQEGDEIRPKRCLALGKPLTVRVTEPPVEGRPEGYVGAIGHAFWATAALDAHNVRLGDPLRLTLTLHADCEPTLLRAPALPPLEGLRVVGEPERTATEETVTFAYTLRPTRVDLLEVPGVRMAWFDRKERLYRIFETGPLPVRVRASNQRPPETPPPGLTRDFSEKSWPMWPWWALGVGAAALAIRLAWRPLAAVGRLAGRLFAARRPLSRARAILAQTQNPAEAAGAVRLWAGQPSLTPEELRAKLAPSAEADEAVEAYRRLEAAAYSGGGDVPEARAALRRLLPKLRLLALVVLLLSPAWAGAADGFARDRAWAASLEAGRPEEVAQAANLWLDLTRAGDDSRATLTNAATLALLAKRPDAAFALLTRCERLHGRSTDGDQAMNATCAALSRPVPGWWRRVAWRQVAGWAVGALGICLLLCAVPRRGLWPWRAALFAAALILAAWATAVWTAATQTALPDPLTPPTEETP